MTSSMLESRASRLAPCLLVLAVGCGGPPARSASGERLPANGVPAATPLTALPSKTIDRDDWDKAVRERLTPACDAHEGIRTADARNLRSADEVLDSWTELRASKGKSVTGSGKKVIGAPEPTRYVTSVGMTCAAGESALQVNGKRYPFDLAWVVSGQGTGKTTSGEDGAGWFTMIEALSFADQRVIFAKVFVPSDANDDTDDTVIVSSLVGYVPDKPEAPIVRVVGNPKEPQLETFIVSKGAGGASGISLRVPEQDPLGRARYLGIATFRVVP